MLCFACFLGTVQIPESEREGREGGGGEGWKEKGGEEGEEKGKGKEKLIEPGLLTTV